MKTPDSIAIIPARGGSKSVPRKNVRPLGGVPLIGRTVSAALHALGEGNVFVSTDDNEISRVARNFGAAVVPRPESLATDTASSEAALNHALEYIAEEHAIFPNVVIFLQCTSPFTSADHIRGLSSAVLEGRGDCALTVRRSHGFLWRIDEAGSGVGVNHDSSVRLRRQDLQPEYLETGAGYAFHRTGYLEARHRFFGKIALVDTSDVPAIEIDDPSDFLAAEALYNAMKPSK